MADEIRLWSDELARDPASLVFIPLAETLRRQGQVDIARKIVLRGLERHPGNAEARDLLARILTDTGELDGAYEEWSMLLSLSPGHVGALKGMAFVRFQQGQYREAEELLSEAHKHEGSLELAQAMDTVRRSSSAGVVATPDPEASPEAPSAGAIFHDIVRDQQQAMLLDRDGLVLAGSYRGADGRELGEEVGARLSGVSDEAFRATRHLGVGAWRAIVFETDAAVVALAPAPAGETSDGLLVLAAQPSTPLGLLRRTLDRCLHRAMLWQSARRA